ncbi:terpene synthase family protein [Morganella morganii]|uniref:terpene synthase family protein n=1 Tax=Morganella morganii TaxID=582 RepID=UPI0034D78A4F
MCKNPRSVLKKDKLSIYSATFIKNNIKDNANVDFLPYLKDKPKLGDKIYHPDFNLKLKPKCHPMHEITEKQVTISDWNYMLAHYGSVKAVENYVLMSMPLFGGYCYPNAYNDRIYHLERMMSITTLIDDSTTHPDIIGDKNKQYMLRNNYIAAINGILPSDNYPIAKLLYEGLIPIKKQLSSKPRVWKRLKESLYKVIYRQTNSIAFQMNELTFVQYLELRRIDNYGDWAAMMTEYAIDVDMTDILKEDKSLNVVRIAAIDSITLVNDPYSFRKEMHISDPVNSVWLLMRLNKITTQQAFNKLASFVRDNERKLINASQRVREGKFSGRDDVQRYVTELEHLASGNAEFHAISTRYFGQKFKGKRFISGEITIEPIPSTDEIAMLYPDKNELSPIKKY